MRLTTERLILREFEKDDFEAVHAYASNIDNLKYMVWGPNDEAATAAFIDKCIAQRLDSPRTHYDFAITLKESGELIGGCGIYPDWGLKEANLGWILHRDYWKRGYMPEAAQALLRFGFEELGLHRIYATCNADNYGSYRVMEKCGMRREAHFLEYRYGRVGERKQWFDEYQYAMLEREWFARRR